jgi:hypothetical protein
MKIIWFQVKVLVQFIIVPTRILVFRSAVSPLRDENGLVFDDPERKAKLLQRSLPLSPDNISDNGCLHTYVKKVSS